MDGQKLKGQVAIVTGGAQNIGRAISTTLAREGASVYIFDVNLDVARVTAEEIAKSTGSKCVAYKVDISSSKEVNETIGRIIEAEGRIDVLVNNAGVLTNHENLLTVTDEMWAREIGVTLSGAFYCSRAVLGKMIEQKRGKIVNIASIAGETGRPSTGPAYSAAKAGVLGLTRSTARNVAKYGINVNAVSPGVVLTSIHDNYPKETIEALLAQVPYSRGGVPQDIANAVLFLASEESDFINGVKLSVNGGSFMS